MIKKGDGYSTTYSIETQASDLSDVQIDIKSNNKEAQEKVNYSVKGKELEINVPNEVVNHSQTQIHFDIKLTAKLVSTLQLGYLVPAQSSRQDMATMQAFQVKSNKLYTTDTQAIIETPTKPVVPTALKTPEIKTNATNPKENNQVKDVVDYKNLLPGKEYDGKEVTASKTNQLLPATGEVKSILLVIVGFLLLILSVLVLRYLSKNR